MTRLVVVADDLTGAADCVVPMVASGTASIVLDHEGDWPCDDIVAVDTDSRHCPPATAAARAAVVADRATRSGAVIYKKIDSTLRGNIVAELRAMVDALARGGPRALVVLAAAFPAAGRTTVGGVVHVNGTPLSAQGRDGDVVGLLRRGGLKPWHVGVEGLADPGTLASIFDQAHAEGLDAVVLDGQTEEHLGHVVAAVDRVRCPVLLVGSGGLARPLGASLAASLPTTETHHGASAHVERGRPELVVVGSYAAESRVQTQRLAQRGVRHFMLPGGEEDLVTQVREALLHGPVVLSPDPDVPVVRRDAPQVSRRLATAAAAALDRAGTLIVTGGETARAVLTAAGVTRLVVLGEIAPGVVRSRVPPLGLDVVTKAGAFGDPDTLLDCLSDGHPHEKE